MTVDLTVHHMVLEVGPKGKAATRLINADVVASQATVVLQALMVNHWRPA